MLSIEIGDEHCHFAGGWLGGSSEPPTAEAVVAWLLDHHELQVVDEDLSDSEALSDVDLLSDLESVLGDVDDDFSVVNDDHLLVCWAERPLFSVLYLMYCNVLMLVLTFLKI